MVKCLPVIALLMTLAGCAWVTENSDYSPGLLSSPSRLSLVTRPRPHPAPGAGEREADVKALDESALTGTEAMLRTTEIIDQALKEGASEKAPTALHDARYFLRIARETAQQHPEDGQKISWAGEDALFFAKRLLTRTREPQEQVRPTQPFITESDEPRGVPIGWVMAGIVAFLILAAAAKRAWRMTMPFSRVNA